MTIKDFLEVKISAGLATSGLLLNWLPSLVEMETGMDIATKAIGLLTGIVGFLYITKKYLNERKRNEKAD